MVGDYRLFSVALQFPSKNTKELIERERLQAGFYTTSANVVVAAAAHAAAVASSPITRGTTSTAVILLLRTFTLTANSTTRTKKQHMIYTTYICIYLHRYVCSITVDECLD